MTYLEEEEWEFYLWLNIMGCPEWYSIQRGFWFCVKSHTEHFHSWNKHCSTSRILTVGGWLALGGYTRSKQGFELNANSLVVTWSQWQNDIKQEENNVTCDRMREGQWRINASFPLDSINFCVLNSTSFGVTSLFCTYRHNWQPEARGYQKSYQTYRMKQERRVEVRPTEKTLIRG